jgi:hypothetical protein
VDNLSVRDLSIIAIDSVYNVNRSADSHDDISIMNTGFLAQDFAVSISRLIWTAFKNNIPPQSFRRYVTGGGVFFQANAETFQLSLNNAFKRSWLSCVHDLGNELEGASNCDNSPNTPLPSSK